MPTAPFWTLVPQQRRPSLLVRLLTTCKVWFPSPRDFALHSSRSLSDMCLLAVHCLTWRLMPKHKCVSLHVRLPAPS